MSTTRGTPAAHALTPVVVHFNASRTRALTESAGSIRIRMSTPDSHGENQYDVVAWSRFVSRVERVDSPTGGEWKMLTLEAIYDRDSISPVVPGSGPPEGFEEQTKGMRESYKCLGWVLASRGTRSIRSGAAGDGSPGDGGEGDEGRVCVVGGEGIGNVIVMYCTVYI